MPQFDKVSSVAVHATVAHHEIHDGDSYVFSEITADLGSDDVVEYIITVPDSEKLPHFGYNVQSYVAAKIEMFRATDKNGVTLKTIFNRNENSPKTATTTIHGGTTGGTVDGTKILERHIGGATATGKGTGTTEEATERILKRNTKYLFRVTSLVNLNSVSLGLFFYEEESSFYES